MTSTISRSPANERVWRYACGMLIASVLLLVANFGTDGGVTWDEIFQSNYGEYILVWFRSGFSDQSALTYGNLFLYGGLFDTAAQLVVHALPFGLYETRHILSALAGAAGIVVCGMTANQLAGRRAAFLAMLMLLLTPPWLGHSLFNPKDVPFGTAAMLATWASVRLAMGPVAPDRRDKWIVGLTMGIALGIRPGGFFLFLYPVAGMVLRSIAMWRRERSWPDKRDIIRRLDQAIGVLAVSVPVAWILMVMTWPWALLSPLGRPLAAMLAASDTQWANGVTLFDGRVYPIADVPLRYLPTWFAITLPEFYLVVAVVAAWWLRTRRPPLAAESFAGLATVVLSVAAPLAAALITRPSLYDAQRHFLFLIPPLAVIAGVVVDAVLDTATRTGRTLVGGALAASFALTSWDIVRLHPYEYVYFNHFFGGLPAAADRFETDYWGASYRAGFEWVLESQRHGTDGSPLRIATCDWNAAARLNYYAALHPDRARGITIVERYEDADLFLAVTRYGCHKVGGPVLHTIGRDGVPLLYVIRVSHDA